MMVKWNWRKSGIIFPQENEHLVYLLGLLRRFASEVLMFFSVKKYNIVHKNKKIRYNFETAKNRALKL